MEKKYSDEQISYIREQSMIYQCACPAQICEVIGYVRNLYEVQLGCIDSTDTDKAVHECIQLSAVKNHVELEQCLTTVLEIEGWDMESLEMPENMKKILLDGIKQ